MPTNDTTVEGDALIEQLRVLPEPAALALYSDLTPRLKWLARQRTTGRRREAIIAHHLITRTRSWP
jgi:hypothetical protein